MWRSRRPATTRIGLALGLALTMAAGGPAQATIEISVYGGAAWTLNSNVSLDRPGGTDLVFHDVGFTDTPFKSPPYYGFRLTHWFESSMNLGLAVDYTHFKTIGDLDETVNVTGTRDGDEVDGPQVLRDTFERLELSNGLNLLTANFLYRHLPDPDEGSLVHRFVPYIGVGAGAAVPHVEVTMAGSETYEYQWTGAAFQAILGVSYMIFEHFSVFAEYKLTWTDVDASLTGGGSVEFEPWSHHVVIGFSVSF